ncbi:hypothetical protein [Nitrosomonas sp. Nm166]|uniref:hypothetical protein n=1 Tax=Nitrosomonas sp. Nm166 TaxID=1881054 RepID=UPI0008E64FF7|nr:hypothetical protein [Nitrosomonas sp. Nm166]SFF16970.1 hypothetical protein SAMN05428977_10621 [Nitrosomonas sp. Nm166]
MTDWEASRQVVILRRPLQGEMLIAQKDEMGWQLLGFTEADRKQTKQLAGYEYAILITNLEYEILRNPIVTK